MQEAARLEQQQSEAARQEEAARLYKAARLIQDSWRSYKNKRIYKFFRDLIKFRLAHSHSHMDTATALTALPS